MYGIFTYIWLKFKVNVGKYASPMDPMGHDIEHTTISNFNSSCLKYIVNSDHLPRDRV